MGANRFATVLHRNTNKITLILIYALLEWILILLLLLNSMFSYLIVKFAEVFGLTPPCPWCTRVDHLFDPVKGGNNINRDFLCEAHSEEISKLGFCSGHRKLVVSRKMCEDCSASTEEGGNGEVILNCSCCGVSLDNDNDKYSSYILLKTSSWDDVLECAHKQNLITESAEYDDGDEKVSGFAADSCGNEYVLDNKSDDQNLENTEKGTEENGLNEEIMKRENLDLIQKDKSVQMCAEEDAPPPPPPDISSEHLEFFLDYSGHKLVPVELIDFVTEEYKVEEDDVTKDREVCVDSEVQVVVKEEVVVVESGARSKIENTFLDFDINEEPKYELLDSVEVEEDGNSLVFPAKGSHLETNEFDNFRVFSLTQWPLEEAGEVQEAEEKEKHSDVQTACEEASQGTNENEGDVSIGTEIPDLDITEEIEIKDSDLSYEPIHEHTSTYSANHCAVNDHGPTLIEEQVAATQSLLVHDRDNITNSEPSVQMQLKETEEDKLPDTPTSMECLNPDKNLLLFEKRDYGTEESLDGNVTSELDGGDGVITIERLKSAVRSERKALQALYTELEEERSASAVATNHTMAMINRLQEDKAAMQMEALQYQRMMEEQVAATQSLLVHDRDNITNSEPSVQMQLKETEEDKLPDTPTSMECLNPDKNLLLFEKRDYGTEESLDGSVTSELDGGDGVVTIERLKSAVRSERKALQALYTELEEERSASAVATNQTMAMINRLQEEKAAMQMEALQYQRMMEEQSEYDQEALQLLNELMVKREKEKQELERELEVYRKKLSDYDIREKMRVLKKSRDGSSRNGFSSASCSNAEDSDGLSVDLNQETKEEEGIYGISDYTNQNTPVNAVVNLEESLVDFEEERLSILEHLKVLEEKLLMVDDEHGQSFEDVKEMDENGDHFNGDHFNGESNGYSNGNNHYRRVAGQKGKSLLPLFDAISDENGDLTMVNGNRFDHDSYEPSFKLEGNKKVAIEEEVDHLYERLQALEADREFLKHCVSSLKKGDKGMDLLQEILQHLHDLRRVELRVRNSGDGAVI